MVLNNYIVSVQIDVKQNGKIYYWSIELLYNNIDIKCKNYSKCKIICKISNLYLSRLG